MSSPKPDAIEHAAERIAMADGLLVAAGSGIGVDSGLPDFRGNEGLWRAYPALGARAMSFTEIANPDAFEADPALAWGFYGHRLALYRATHPHAGFALLKRWAERMPHGHAVFTSNVDGQFTQAGFESPLVECHGSIHWLQCSVPCGPAIWPADDFEPQVDTLHCRLIGAPPQCPMCGALARPNVLMFGDSAWLDQRTAQQHATLLAWLKDVRRPVVVEIGAGTAVPSVRHFTQQLVRSHGARLVRINLHEAAVSSLAHVGIARSALAALQAIDQALAR